MTTSGDCTERVAERYVVGEPLGRGGMGTVYRATDQVLGREVAIKLMLPVRDTSAAAARFEREARAAAMLSDQHVVAAYDFGPHDGGYFLVMELVEGRTVSEELRRHGPLSAERAVDIIRQAAAGVAAAHQAGIIHRDLKPGNLLLTTDGQVKVADFGIVRFLDDTTTTLTATGQIVGTSHYLSPERVLGKPAGRPSDVYALGCVLYQLVTGHPPFMAEDPASIMYQHVETAPVAPSELRSELAGEFEALLFWLLAKDPADRPTAAELARGAIPPVDVAQAAVAQDAITEQLLRRRGSRKGLAAACAVVAVAVAATAGVLLDANTVEQPATSDPTPYPGASTPAPQRSTTVRVLTTIRVTTPALPKQSEQTAEAKSTGVPGPTKPAKSDPTKPGRSKPDHPQKPGKPND